MKTASSAQAHPSLQRYISKSGHCSRRKAAELIAAGKVELDGRICTEAWQPVRPGQGVRAEGVGIQPRPVQSLLYLALHKPPGYLTSNSDPEGRPCAIDLIRPVYSERLFHVGRLDKNSSGLIFFTNDGDFAQAVQHPSRRVEKEYEVKTRKYIPEFLLRHWMRGIAIDGVKYQLRRYQMIGQRQVRLVLTEGLNREIRRVFEHFHIPLKRVHRLRIGIVKLSGLAPGAFRKLRPYELKALQSDEGPQDLSSPVKRKQQSARHDGRHKKAQRGLYNAPARPFHRSFDRPFGDAAARELPRKSPQNLGTLPDGKRQNLTDRKRKSRGELKEKPREMSREKSRGRTTENYGNQYPRRKRVSSKRPGRGKHGTG